MSLFKKHPAGLPFLFFSEMCERFGYYLILGILFLYLTDAGSGGLALDQKQAADLFGTYIAFVFVTPFFGGLLADRILGYRWAISMGAILMGAGYFCLMIPGISAFYAAMVLLVVGNGLLKPNIATFLGMLYRSSAYSGQRDNGFNLFYMASNIGALVCNFIAAYLRHHYGWGYAFGAAGIAMFTGLLIFWSGNATYAANDYKTPRQPSDISFKSILIRVFIPAFIGGVVGWLIPGNILGSDSTDAFVLGALPIIFFYIILYRTSVGREKQVIGALLTIMAVVSVFWTIFKQNGTALTHWAEHYTNRSVTGTPQKVLQYTGAIQTLPYKKDSLPKTDESYHLVRDTLDKPILTYDYPDYFKNTEPSQRHPGTTYSLVSTEIFLSFNPFFVILFTPILLLFFSWLHRRNKEPDTIVKILIGLLITGASTLIMCCAVWASANGATKVSPNWLIGTYAMITLGELFLSPMGLSLVSRLAPRRYAALLMGGWMLSTSLGNKLSGVLAGLWDRYDHKSWFFLTNLGLVLFAAVILLLMLPKLREIIQQPDSD